MTTESWHLKGEYFENCNCDVLCPCVIPGPPNDPTEGHCDVGFAFHIQEGIMDLRRGRGIARWEGKRGTKYCSITYTAEGQTRSVAIPEIMDFAVEGIAAGRGNEPMSSVLTLARGTASTYNDHGMSWDNTGKNGHYAAFEWQWP